MMPPATTPTVGEARHRAQGQGRGYGRGWPAGHARNGRQAQTIPDSWKAWLSQNNAVVMTVLFLIFAVVLIGKGIAGI
jgi:hypothetical protein